MQFGKAFQDISKGVGLYNLWMGQAYHEITAKYKRTILGPFWTVGQMVSMSIALSLMIGALMGNDLREALPYVMSGMIAWFLVSYPLAEGVEIFMMNTGIIKNHAYPFTFYIFEATFRSLILLAHNLVVFWVFMALIKSFVMPSPMLVVGIFVLYLNVFFWSTMTSMLASRYRDMRYLFPYVGQIIYFLTPVFWKPVPGHTSVLRLIFIDHNPFSALVAIVRKPLLGELATVYEWELVAGVTALGFILFIFSFAAFRRRIAFWV